MNLIHALQDYDNPNSPASRFRRARARRIVELIASIAKAKGRCRIADLGGRADYWGHLFDRAFLEASGVHITLVNTEDMPVVEDPMFTSVQGDATSMPQYADDAFDLVHSNSVVEHVGDWPRMEAFAAETRRLAPAYYAQTPYFWFPVEPHFSAPFFHWRSEQGRARSLLRRRHGWVDRAADVGEAMRAVQHARLLDRTQMRFLFPDAELHDERVLGLTKSLIAVRTER
jgi:methyltransferase family protein